MKKIVLHVGMPKCASSAIQEALSSYSFSLKNENLVYVSIDASGNLIYGKTLAEQAKKSPFRYSASEDIEILNNLDKEKMKKIENDIEILFKNYSTIIFSNEGWGVKPTEVNSFFSKLFENKIFFEVEVIGYIRPQVEWINSAWWQWGAWTDHSLEYWFERTYFQVNWYEIIKKWKSFSWVDSCKFQFLNSNVVLHFMNEIGCTYEKQAISNKSLPESLLRFFQHNRELRKSAHHSVNEFILMRWLELKDTKTPWVLNRNQVEKVINFYKDDNFKLLHDLNVNGIKNFNDSKWLSIEAYKDKNIKSWTLEILPDYMLSELLNATENAIGKINNLPESNQMKIHLSSENLTDEEKTLFNLKKIIEFDTEIRKGSNPFYSK